MSKHWGVQCISIFIGLSCEMGCGESPATLPMGLIHGPPPVPPKTQGFYGKMMTYDDIGDGPATPVHSQVCAGDPSTAVVHAPTDSLACVETSLFGNYTLELPLGPFVACTADLSYGHVYSCDTCTFVITANDKIRRDHMAGQGGGDWFGAACP